MIAISTLGTDAGRSGLSTYLDSLLREWTKETESLELLEVAGEEYASASPAWKRTILPRRLRSALFSQAWHLGGLPLLASQRRYRALFLPAGNRRLCPWAPCPTLATVHDLASFHLPGKYALSRSLYVRRLLPWLLRRQTHLIAVSRSSRDDLVRYVGVPEERITVIYEGVDHARFHPRPPDECRAYLEAAHGLGEPFFLYVARLEHPGKNHLRLLEAFGRWKQAGGTGQLVLVGADWDESWRIHQARQESPWCRDIRSLGFVPAASLPYLYGAARAMVLPSLFEGFGLPVLEAMACGCPVACSDRGSLPEVAGAAALLFDPEQIEEMTAILHRLALPEVEDSLRRRGLERARQFRWATAARRTLELLRELAGRN